MKVNTIIKNKIDNEKSRIVLQFFLTLITFIFIGVLYCVYFDSTLESVCHQKTLAHFYLPLKVGDIFNGLLLLSRFDSICLAVILVFSFSFLNYIATDIILIIYALKLGIVIALVISMNGIIGALPSALFIILEITVLLTAFIYACKMAIASLEIKKCALSGRLKLNKKVVFEVIYNTVTAQGTVLFINFLHCLIMR